MLWTHKKTELGDCFVDRAFIARHNVIYDSHGVEPNKFLRELMRRARFAANYRVVVCGAYAPWQTTMARAQSRGAAEGRAFDPGFFKKIYDTIYPAGELDEVHLHKFREE